MTRDSSRLRIATVGLVSISLFAALFARLWFLQVMKQGTYDKAAQVAAYRTILEPAPRGRILDRNGKVLVDNKPRVVVTVDTQKLAALPHGDTVISKLAALLNQYMPGGKHYTLDSIRQQLRSKQVSPYQPVPVATDVPQALQVYLAERSDQYPSVAAEDVTLRAYPYGSLAAHVLGYVGPIPESQYQAHEHDKNPYTRDATVGRAGVEASFERFLRGVPGKRVVEVDPAGRIIRTVRETPPVPGDDVYLSIDADAQAVAELALAAQLKAARSQCNTLGCPPAPGGAFVSVDPTNGQVVAMASNPTYDPGWFVPTISAAHYQELTSKANHQPFVNRAVAEQYQPGSTFKLISAVAGLRAGVINPGFVWDDTGEYSIIGCKGGDAAHCTPHGDDNKANGAVDLSRALTVSSDTYFFRVGDLLWNSQDKKEEIQRVAHEFGFGQKTGIELGDEASGYVATPESEKKRHDENPKAFPNGDQWFSGNNTNLATGQAEIYVTPLQLANAYATFANGGTRYRPTLLEKVTKFRQPEAVVYTQKPRVAAHVDLPGDWRSAMLTGFEGVTTDGTAADAFSAASYPMGQLPVAGKTGTAENIDPQTGNKQQNTSLFVGFGPSDAPRFSTAAVFEQAGYGAAIAAPSVVDFYLPLAQTGRFPEVKPAPSAAAAVPTSAPVAVLPDRSGSGGAGGPVAAPLEAPDQRGGGQD